MEIYVIALVIGMFQGVVLSLLLAAPKFKSHRLLSCIVAIFTYSSFVSFLWSSKLIVSFPHLLGTAMPLMFLIGPLYYLYLRRVFNHAVNFKDDAAHFIPFVLCIAFIIPFFLKTGDEKITYILKVDITRINLPTARLIGYGFLMIHIAWYLGWSTRFLLALQPSKKKHFPLLRKWSIAIHFGLIILTMCYLGTYLLYAFSPIQNAIYLDALHLLITFFIHFVAYAMIYVLGVAPPTELQKPQAQLSDVQQTELNTLTAIQKVYLNPTLKMADVAMLLNMSPQKLSETINSQFGKSFTDFINEFRVREVSQILRDKEHEMYDLDGIAQMCGFQNRTTLTRVFKKHTGLSPTQFRQRTGHASTLQ